MAARSHVEFQSERFPPYPDEDEAINPGRYGRKLAEYLSQKLGERGINTEEPFCEDWGVVLPVSDPSLPVWIGCGNYEEYPHGFLCFVEPSKPAWLRVFARNATDEAIARVASALDSILASDPAIREVRWWNGRNPR